MLSIRGDREAMTTLGSRLRDARLARNLSQSYIASIVGVSLPTYRKIESGAGTVEFRHMAGALAVLGYAEALAELIPPVDPTMTMKELVSLPERKRASAAKRKP
jgi:transcriptional regulator with XRE-family HTH domain